MAYLTQPYKKTCQSWEVTVLVRKVLLAVVCAIYPSSFPGCGETGRPMDGKGWESTSIEFQDGDELKLVGGLEHFVFHIYIYIHILGIISKLTNIFSEGLNPPTRELSTRFLWDRQ